MIMTNDTGLNSQAVAEYTVMGVLVAARRYDRAARQTDAGQ